MCWVGFALETGLRKSNIAGLTWAQVDFSRALVTIYPDQAKARKAIPVPLSPSALSLLKSQLGNHPMNVFTYKGKIVNELNTKAFRSALRRAGLSAFRFHDIRHTWASWHAQNGTPLTVLQELGGWNTPDMVRHYAHLSVEHLRDHVTRNHDLMRKVLL